MIRKILSTTVVAVIAFSGCSTKAEVKPKVEAKKAEVKQEVKKTEVKAKETAQKAVSKVSGAAAIVPASEFFKSK
ncbi:MAG: hypothetical protein GXO60_00940 [Epsilonproteobacteria bacterium]|nr:hypothetical protein [Campylobacterota bacterium]